MSDEPEKNELDAPVPLDAEVVSENDDTAENGDPNSVAAERYRGNNDYFRTMMDRNFLEYASYVIKDRAIPDVDDGLKPVQRRVLWALYQVYDGRTHKVANVVGNTMHYHPHGNASIEDALVVLANKEYYITRQGNFGNILTGSPAAAGRYIECSLSPLGHEVLFNNDITEFVDTYDGRGVEPVTLPAKVPSLLMLGSDGIAVGMATKIMPHNFNELLEAEIAVLRGEEFELYPDFQQGGLMDVREYNDGNGKITLRAKIEIVGRDLIIREIPATTSTETLVASIEKAAEKNKIKISSVNDYTTDKVEIKVVPTRGYDPEKTMQGLYMYTDCSVSISVNMTVIRENRPVQMSVSEVLRRNADKLLEYLKRELEIDLAKQEDLFHAKTLAQIFFENRIYKKIEECKSEKEEYVEVHAGLAPFRHLLRRDVADQDIDKLLALPVRRISRFDIEKNQRELAEEVRDQLPAETARQIRQRFPAPHRDRAFREDRPPRGRFEQHQGRLGPQERLRRHFDQERRHSCLQRIRPFSVCGKIRFVQSDRAAAGEAFHRQALRFPQVRRGDRIRRDLPGNQERQILRQAHRHRRFYSGQGVQSLSGRLQAGTSDSPRRRRLYADCRRSARQATAD